MKFIQLYRDNEEIIATDGIMIADARLSVKSIICNIKCRNLSFMKNFPNKVADSFTMYSGRIGSSQSKIIKI